MIEEIIFYSLAGLIVLGAILTVTLRNIFRSALALAFTLTATAGIYLMLEAPFIAAIQVLIYVGAITVLILFAIMLTEHFSGEKIRSTNSQVWLNLILCAILAFTFISLIIQNPLPQGEEAVSGIRTMGELIFSQYLLPFEVLSLLLLVALVGAIVIARNSEGEKK